MDFFYIEKRRPKVKKGVVRATASERTEPSGKEGEALHWFLMSMKIRIMEFYKSHIWIVGFLKLMCFYGVHMQHLGL